MKVIAFFMVLIGVTIAYGAVLELYYSREWLQFWVGAFTTPAGAFFALAGVMLWFLGRSVRRTVLISALAMASATIAATALQVMGPAATLMGMIGSLMVIGWFWRTRGPAVERVSA